MKVYECIHAIQSALAKDGIPKAQRATGAISYNFRGIDDMLAALAPLLAEHKMLITPYLQERTVAEYQSKNGGSIFNTCVTVDYHMISVEDQTPHVVRVPGEAMDSGDKGTNKAMSSAYKNMAIQTFCIPTKGDNDSENQTHEVSGSRPTPAPTRSVVDNEMPFCTGCGKNTSVMKNKFEGPEFVCFKGRGGCGEKFDKPLPSADASLDAIFSDQELQEMPF